MDMGIGRGIGVLGGTFDPIHYGHIALGKKVASTLKLKRILFMPAGNPWMKSDKPVSSAHHRLKMLELGIAGIKEFSFSDMEIKRSGPTYTYETILDLTKDKPETKTIYLILGWDAIKEFHRWKNSDRLLKLVRIVAVARPGYEEFSTQYQENKDIRVFDEAVVIDKSISGITSTDIRERIKLKQSINNLVPKDVEKYILEHGLYKQEG